METRTEEKCGEEATWEGKERPAKAKAPGATTERAPAQAVLQGDSLTSLGQQPWTPVNPCEQLLWALGKAVGSAKNKPRHDHHGIFLWSRATGGAQSWCDNIV